MIDQLIIGVEMLYRPIKTSVISEHRRNLTNENNFFYPSLFTPHKIYT